MAYHDHTDHTDQHFLPNGQNRSNFRFEKFDCCPESICASCGPQIRRNISSYQESWSNWSAGKLEGFFMIFVLLIQDMTTVPRPDKFKVLTEWRTLVGRVVDPPAKATFGLCKVKKMSWLDLWVSALWCQILTLAYLDKLCMFDYMTLKPQDSWTAPCRLGNPVHRQNSKQVLFHRWGVLSQDPCARGKHLHKGCPQCFHSTA